MVTDIATRAVHPVPSNAGSTLNAAVHVGVAYVLVAWLLAQVAELALDSFEAPGWVIKAVLPFVDMSPVKDQEYFTDGLTENLREGLNLL